MRAVGKYFLVCQVVCAAENCRCHFTTSLSVAQGRLGGLLFLAAEAAGKPRLDDLLGAGNQHGVLGNISGDGSAGGGVGACADGNGGDQIGIAAEEGMIADGGTEFFSAVKVGDGDAASEIDAAAAIGITDIGKVGNGGLFADTGVFDLDEIADLAAGGDVAAGANLRERPDTFE